MRFSTAPSVSARVFALSRDNARTACSCASPWLVIQKARTWPYTDEVPAGTEGIVIGARKFSRRMHLNDEQKKLLKRQMAAYEDQMNGKAIALFRQMVRQMNEISGTEMVDPSTRQKVGASDIPEVILEQIENFDIK